MNAKKVMTIAILCLIGALAIGYALLCMFFMVIGIVASDFNFLGIGFGGLTLPLAGYVVIGDIKALFF